ncbi:MAG: ABC transporter permease [Chloroflexi bacterium]|nr:ABC transporter permease [Chloroflexota bacterium]
MSTPLTLAAIGSVFAERSGVINIALEGMMLAGAFAGFLVAYLTGNVWLGLCSAVGVGALLGLVHSFVCVSLGGDQIVSGIAINVLSLGLTGSLSRMIFGVTPSLGSVPRLPVIGVPLLSHIPVLGPALFQQTLLVYLSIALVPAAAFVLFRTHWGRSIRAVGEHPRAAHSAGISVYRCRYVAVALSGMLAGLAGAFLSVGQVGAFGENMTAGRGFIALAAVYFGKLDPVGAFFASLLFGGADALQLRLQTLFGTQVPVDLFLMFPYVLAFLTLAGFVGRATMPAASGTPYTKE